MRLMAAVSDRKDYTDAGEKFENVTMLLFRPAEKGRKPKVQLFDAKTEEEISESDYFVRLREIYNRRNPSALIGDDDESPGEDA
jgi:hypothetical protein